jgi:ABC-type branched-subunit amino acid transport system ATPase component
MGNPSLVLLDEPSEGCRQKSSSRWSTHPRDEEEGVSIVVSEQNCISRG